MPTIVIKREAPKPEPTPIESVTVTFTGVEWDDLIYILTGPAQMYVYGSRHRELLNDLLDWA